MAQQDQKRKSLFDKFSEHLKLIKAHGLLPDIELKYDSTYICPICLDQFSENDLKEDAPNRLTLEDAPPDALGGKKIALTCKKCNNTCGHEIDAHLAERMVELDSRAFLPGTSSRATFTKDGKIVNGELKVEEDGTIKAVHHTKTNNPPVLDDYMKTVKPDTDKPSISITYKKSKVDNNRLAFALLKTGYILTFAKFGYSFIMNKSYDLVREQLKNPDKIIYPIEFWTSQPFDP